MSMIIGSNVGINIYGKVCFFSIAARLVGTNNDKDGTKNNNRYSIKSSSNNYLVKKMDKEPGQLFLFISK